LCRLIISTSAGHSTLALICSKVVHDRLDVVAGNRGESGIQNIFGAAIPGNLIDVILARCQKQKGRHRGQDPNT